MAQVRTDTPSVLANPERSSAENVRRGLLALAAALLLGGVTSWAQGLLPDALAPLANSAGTWTLLTVALVAATGVGIPWTAVLGVGGFVALVAGYTVASELRGLSYSPAAFGAIGVIVGPFVGIAAGWLRRGGWQLQAAVALLAGITLGEAAYGLTVVDDSTSPVAWTLLAACGAGFLALGVRRRASAGQALAGWGGALGVAAAFVVAYRAFGGVGL